MNSESVMKNMTIQAVAQACGGTLILKNNDSITGSTEITAITTDSRKVTCGCLFVAIPGNRVDGHDFIEQVIRDGACAVLGERAPEDLNCSPEEMGAAYIQVPSSLQAVKGIARYYLQQLQIPVVGVTGSVGKTSTKEMIASVLAQKYRVLKTAGNFNNELGLPLTVFRLRETDEIAVLEMGISDFGEMHRLADVARPDTCVITNIGTCHLEQLGDRDGVLRAKTEIFGFLRPDGHIVLNGEDDKLAGVHRMEDTIRFAVQPDAEMPAPQITADEIVSRGINGSSCRIHTPQGDFRTDIHIPGIHAVYNAMAATAVGLIYGLSIEEISRGIAACETIAGRFRIIESGMCTIIDDCYNANPMSMKASLNVLKHAEGRKVALLGDMGELGANEKALHEEVGTAAAGFGIDAYYCAGPLSENLLNGLKAAGALAETRHFSTTSDLLEALPELIRKGDTVLIKASHFMGFEKLVEAVQQLTA